MSIPAANYCSSSSAASEENSSPSPCLLLPPPAPHPHPLLWVSKNSDHLPMKDDYTAAKGGGGEQGIREMAKRGWRSREMKVQTPCLLLKRCHTFWSRTHTGIIPWAGLISGAKEPMKVFCMAEKLTSRIPFDIEHFIHCSSFLFQWIHVNLCHFVTFSSRI